MKESILNEYAEICESGDVKIKGNYQDGIKIYFSHKGRKFYYQSSPGTEAWTQEQPSRRVKEIHLDGWGDVTMFDAKDVNSRGVKHCIDACKEVLDGKDNSKFWTGNIYPV